MDYYCRRGQCPSIKMMREFKYESAGNKIHVIIKRKNIHLFGQIGSILHFTCMELLLKWLKYLVLEKCILKSVLKYLWWCPLSPSGSAFIITSRQRKRHDILRPCSRVKLKNLKCLLDLTWVKVIFHHYYLPMFSLTADWQNLFLIRTSDNDIDEVQRAEKMLKSNYLLECFLIHSGQSDRETVIVVCSQSK